MPFKKGNPGRTPGTPNKATRNAREAIAAFVDSNANRVQGWLDAIAETQGPAAAYRCWLDLLEYHVPKLARHEHTGKDGEPIKYEPSPIYLVDGPPPSK